MELIERLRPPLVVDLHSPLELLLVRGAAPRRWSTCSARRRVSR